MTTAMIKLGLRRERGRKIVEVRLPRRVLTALRSMDPESVRFTFGTNESFELGAGELHDALTETYKKRRRKGEAP